MYVVQTSDLTKIYENRYIALNALNLRVEKGTVFGLVGPNGAGKSTTFRILLGLQRPTAGSVSVFGDAMTPERADIRRRVGYLPTNPSFPRHMTPITYLEFVGSILGMDQRQAKVQLARLLQAVDLASAAAQLIHGFSTGMMTRLGIAAALMGTVYWRLLQKVAADRFQVLGPVPTRLGRPRKVLLVFNTWLRHLSGKMASSYGV